MGPTALRALRLLADGRFHSGTAIARELGRSRAAVCDALQGARQSGIEIHSVPGRGYRLPHPVDFLDADRVNTRLAATGCRSRVAVLEETDSTSTQLAALAATGAASGTAIAAEWQSAGRGRRGRAWRSSIGGSLTFSVLWRFDRGPAHLAGLSLALAAGVAQALEAAGCAGVGLKWPNDLVAHWRKLGGILVETMGEMQGPTAAVVGIGLNYRLSDSLARHIDQPVIDLAECSRLLAPRNELLAALIASVEDTCSRFERTGFAGFRDAWRARHAYAGERVSIQEGEQPPRIATVVDVADDGALLVSFGGAARRVTSAEVSLRPARAKTA